MNVLVIDPQTACVEASETPTIEFLQSYGFRTIPVPMRNAYGFGGGLHCATADVWHTEAMFDQLPMVDEDAFVWEVRRLPEQTTRTKKDPLLSEIPKPLSPWRGARTGSDNESTLVLRWRPGVSTSLSSAPTKV